MGKAKMSVTNVFIDEVQAVQGTSTFGHNFDFNAALSVSKRTAGFLSGEGIDCPDLKWKEDIEWFKRLPEGTWHFVDRVSNDMYKVNPDSKTFRDWGASRYTLASDPALNDPPNNLVVKAVHKGGEKAAKRWIAKNGLNWKVRVAKDKPALGLNPGASSAGGGGASLVTSNTRRRVIDFDLSFKGNLPRASATQILEMVNGKPTIIKFFDSKIPKSRANDINELESWRDELRRSVHD